MIMPILQREKLREVKLSLRGLTAGRQRGLCAHWQVLESLSVVTTRCHSSKWAGHKGKCVPLPGATPTALGSKPSLNLL